MAGELEKTSKDTGGAAFPDKRRVHRAGYATDDFDPVPGMTLRDYFAARAMQGMWSCTGVNFGTMKAQAAQAYRMADAMIAERES